MKNFVSKIGDFSRVLPFSQPISPTLANGVTVSFSGAGSGACSASGTVGTAGAAAGTVRAAFAASAATAASAGAAAAGGGAAAGAFITRSFLLALPAITSSAGATTSGTPSTWDVMTQEPGGTSAKEYTPSLPDIVARMPPPFDLTAVTVAPATGSLAEFVTMPTIAPSATVAAGSEGSAPTAGSTVPASRTEIRSLG